MINKTYDTRTHEPCVPTNQIDANFDTPSYEVGTANFDTHPQQSKCIYNSIADCLEKQKSHPGWSGFCC